MSFTSGTTTSNGEPTNNALRVPVETVVQDPQVYDIEATGKAHLDPPLNAQEEMTRQISRLWELHTNFQGLSDYDSQSEASDTSGKAKDEKPSKEKADDLDAYAVRAKVHEQLLLAQSEIQVSLDMVRLLVAAKKRATRDAVAAALQTAAPQLVKHDQVLSTGAASADPDVLDQVTVGGLPFPVGILDTIRTDATHSQGAATQRREDELKLVLGAKYRQLDAAANTLHASSQRLKKVVSKESVFWRTAFELRRRNWVVQQQRQLMGHHAGARPLHTYADRYFVRYGYSDSGSSFADDSLAELIRDTAENNDEGDTNPDAMDVDEPSGAVPLYIQRSDTRYIQVRLNATYKQPAATEHTGDDEGNGFADNGEFVDNSRGNSTAFDQAHHRLLCARRAAFDRELYYRLCKEARVLELGSVRASAKQRGTAPGSLPSVHDTLVTTLSRDDVSVRFEWILDDNEAPTKELGVGKQTFVQWQCKYYSRLALIMAAMYQRHMHRSVNDYYLGHGLSTCALVSAGARGNHPPDAFVAVHTSSAGTGMLGGSPSVGAPGGGSVDAQEHGGSSLKPAAPGGTTAAAAGAGAATVGASSGATVVTSVSGGSTSGTSPVTPATPGGGNNASESTAATIAASTMQLGSSSVSSSGIPTSTASTAGATTFAVSRPDLLILAPVLQSVQFAKWQHIISATTQRACAAWQRLVEEPIEVVSHFARIYRTPATDLDSHISLSQETEWKDFCSTGQNVPDSSPATSRSTDEHCQGMCYVVRLRFLGGTVMAFRIDDEGRLIFAKGYFPPPVPATTTQSATDTEHNAGEPGGSVLWSRPEQMFIHRVFRIIPLSGLGDFVDQLRRELQSLLLLRVAAALSRRNYYHQRIGRKCQMGQWYVHQSQLCVVGEWWEGARHRQIVGVAKWGSNASGQVLSEIDSDRGIGDSSADWDLALYFGPKHPTIFDAVAGNRLAGTIIPWITCYPPSKHVSGPDAPQRNNVCHQLNKTFEQKLIKTLVSAF
ncbi:hypothetical protein IW138_005193 [Coemansia sp. RSA 986]|nr:hypothetical protein IW138_005193 [Coemansia sp. RSA 986]